jgi:hypothetical protein
MYAQQKLLQPDRRAIGPRSHIVPRRSRAEDLEYSDYGRDPRLGPGWYILPLLAMGVMLACILTFAL